MLSVVIFAYTVSKLSKLRSRGSIMYNKKYLDDFDILVMFAYEIGDPLLVISIHDNHYLLLYQNALILQNPFLIFNVSYYFDVVGINAGNCLCRYYLFILLLNSDDIKFAALIIHKKI